MQDRRRVLFVDDDLSASVISPDAIDAVGEAMTVLTAESETAATARLEPEGIDCVVVADGLPTRSGLSFVETVRKRYPTLPVILYSNRAIAAEAFDAGVTEFVYTPAVADQPELFVHRLESAVAGQQVDTGDFGTDNTTSGIASQTRPNDEEQGDVNRAGETLIDEFAGHQTETPETLPSYVLDETRTVVGVSDSFLEQFGTTREAVLDRPIDDVLDETTDIGEGRFEFERQHDDYSETVTIRQSTCSTEGERGDYVVGIVEDQSDQRRFERKIEHYEAILETVPIGLLSVSEKGTVLWANEAYYTLVGLTREELIGMNFQELVERGHYDPEIIEVYQQHLRELLSSSTDTEEFQWEVTLTTVTGETIQSDSRTALLPRGEDGEFRGTVTAFRDVTKQREYEKQLERQNDRLEQFASLVSHDLRNPLGVAQGYLEILEEQSNVDEPIEMIDQSLSRMEELIDDLLELAKQGEQLSDREWIAISTTVEDAWNTVETDAATLLVDTELELRADPPRLRQLFENLFRNAIEHGRTDKDDEVTIHVGEFEYGFYVEDDGPGIPDENKDRVLELGKTTAEGGTGFGLGIVNEIVVAHGWSITVTDSSTGGARFEIQVGDHSRSA